MMFGPSVALAAQNHAKADWPKESVGLVIDGVYCPVLNLHDEPKKHFKFDAKLLMTQPVQAIVHSHPNGNYEPSINDQEQQIATGIPWAIVPCCDGKPGQLFWWGDDLPIMPLKGRQYRLGPAGSDGKSDCYALVRDYYRLQRNVTLPEVPRNVELYQTEKAWYDTLFQQFGFREIKAAEVREGDLMLVKILQRVTNHALIVTTKGMALHHFTKNLSGESPLGRYVPFVTRYIRYVK
jgi:proteasome lid subunit RPN8/RPN11